MTDFPAAEFEARAETAQRLMAGANLDALWLTTEAEVSALLDENLNAGIQ